MVLQADHDSLTPFVLAVEADGTRSRDLSATVSAQNGVIKDLVVRVAQLEQRLAAVEALLAR